MHSSLGRCLFLVPISSYVFGFVCLLLLHCFCLFLFVFFLLFSSPYKILITVWGLFHGNRYLHENNYPTAIRYDKTTGSGVTMGVPGWAICPPPHLTFDCAPFIAMPSSPPPQMKICPLPLWPPKIKTQLCH